MSARTLRRKLREEKTSFRKLVDELHMEMAIRYLRETDLTVEHISELLGFSDVANLRQAFRRWTKAAPHKFRKMYVSRFVVAKMVKEHVYSDPDWLTGDRLEAKLIVTRAPGARHASVRFVTGGLDLVADRGAFLDLAQQAKTPILAVYGDQTPAKSRAEIEALSVLPNVSVNRLPAGMVVIPTMEEEAARRRAANARALSTSAHASPTA
jgi:Helix-turn-helix domain